MNASLGEWDDDPAAGPTADQANQPPLYFETLDQFVQQIIIQIFRRQVGPQAPQRWSAEWWRSGEAILRLEALWRSWENLRHDPAFGMSTWLRDHADHHMQILLDPDTGPFKRSQDRNNHGDPLPYAPPPEGMFPPA